MKFILTIAFVLMVTVSAGVAASRSPEGADNGDKIPKVISGYITKIDLKKKELTVNGTEVTPASQPQKFTASESFQAPGGGHGGGGRGGSSGGRGGGGGRGRGSAEASQDFSINIASDTIIETEKGALTLNDLRVQD